MTKSRRVLLIIVALAVIGLVLVTSAVLVKILVLDRPTKVPVEAMAISAEDKVLIIAPHPDDETLSSGALAKRAIEAGATVKVVIVTSGDGNRHAAEWNSKTLNPNAKDYRALGEKRHKESIAGMRELGVTDLVFLGYADGSTNTLWRTNWDNKNPHMGLNGSTRVPYNFAYHKGAVCSGQNLVKDLSAVVEKYQPTVIIYPTPEDLHHDHWAVNAFVQYVLVVNNIKAREYTYLVHYGDLWPDPPTYFPIAALTPPSGLAEIDAKWTRRPMSRKTRDIKLAAIKKYRSQILSRFWLGSFVRANELFAVYPNEKTTRAKKAPSFAEGKGLPGVVVKDYDMSELAKHLGGKGDIRRFAFAYDNDFAYVTVQFKEAQAADVVVMMNMRFFTSSGVQRLDVRVFNGEAKAVKRAGNSVVPAKGVKLVKNTKLVVVKVPAVVIGGAPTMMLNVDTFKDYESEDNWLDRTVWRRIELD